MSEVATLVRNRIVEHILVDASEIKPHPLNWRDHPAEQSAVVSGLLTTIGIIDELTCYRSEREGGALVLIDGHLRREIGGLWPVTVVDLTDEEADLILATLHPSGDMAKVNSIKLSELLGRVNLQPVPSVPVQGLLDMLARKVVKLAPTGIDAEPQVERAEELRKLWGVEAGQIWHLGDHRIICGDCTDPQVVARLMAGETAEMMFTDPPYGVDYTGGHFHSNNPKIKRARERLAGDDAPTLYRAFLPVVLPYVDGPCYIWFADRVAKPVFDALDALHCEIHALIIWHKINAQYGALNAQYKQRHEPLLYFKPKGSTLRWVGPTDECTIWEVKRESRNEYHPTQKPVELATRAIANHSAKVVADFFLGSGSTLIACEQLGRACRAVELKPGYVAVALQRYKDATGVDPVLAEEYERMVE